MSAVEGQSICSGDGCGRTIRFVLTLGGKRLPLDPDPHPDGNVIRVEHEGKIRARVLGGSEMPADGPAWRPHWITCPAAPAFRRRKAATTPRCRICRTTLHPLAVSAGWTTHPLCGSPADFRDMVTAAKDAD